MKSLLAVILLAAAPLAAQDGPQPYLSNPEQFRGQFARLRLELLYPRLVSEKPRSYGSDPDGRLAEFMANSAPVLKNIDGLIAYLRAGLKDPRAAEGADRWDEAWMRLDEELGRLEPIIADGEALLGAPVSPSTRAAPSPEEKPEFDSPEGQRLHRASIFAAHAKSLRKRLAARGEIADQSLARPFPR
ncbi:MAG: hypothetical protein ACHQ2Z_03830 [Elusimicrobiota bacterium]